MWDPKSGIFNSFPQHRASMIDVACMNYLVVRCGQAAVCGVSVVCDVLGGKTELQSAVRRFYRGEPELSGEADQ